MPGSSDPYRTAGLARNPFVADPPEALSDEVWIDRGVPPPLPNGRRFVQLLGPQGAGKTSHLLRFRSAAPGPYFHVPPGLGRLRLPPVAPIAYWDEADRIPGPVLAWALRQAARWSATIVAGTHRDLTSAAARSGLAVETHRLGPLDVRSVSAFAARRIAAAACGPVSIELDPDDAAEIARAAGASLRAAGDLLHAWAARTVRAGSDRPS